MPELSDSHNGITLNAGREGGMLDEGDVSRGLELSSQESESDILAVCGDKGKAWWRAKLPFPANISETRRGGEPGWSLDRDTIPDRLS